MNYKNLLSLSFLTLWFLPSCKPGKVVSEGVIRTIVMLHDNASIPYKQVQEQNLLRLTSLAENFEFLSNDAGGNAKKQAEQFGLAMQGKPLAILLSPVNPEVISDQVTAAVAQGVIVIGIGEKAMSLPCTTVITSNQNEVGRLAGEVTVRALTRKAEGEGGMEATGRVVEVRGDESSTPSLAMHEGFAERVAKASGVIIVHDAPGNWTSLGGKERITDAKRLQTSFDVVFAHNDAMAAGASLALGDQRENTLIIGADGYLGAEGGLTLVTQGVLDASIFQPILVDLAWKIILKKIEAPHFVPQPSYRIMPVAITPSNADEILRNGLPPLPEL